MGPLRFHDPYLTEGVCDRTVQMLNPGSFSFFVPCYTTSAATPTLSALHMTHDQEC
jgi:hypothetical protein